MRTRPIRVHPEFQKALEEIKKNLEKQIGLRTVTNCDATKYIAQAIKKGNIEAKLEKRLRSKKENAEAVVRFKFRV